jgi:PAS domain S-box-containing protein
MVVVAAATTALTFVLLRDHPDTYRRFSDVYANFPTLIAAVVACLAAARAEPTAPGSRFWRYVAIGMGFFAVARLPRLVDSIPREVERVLASALYLLWYMGLTLAFRARPDREVGPETGTTRQLELAGAVTLFGGLLGYFVAIPVLVSNAPGVRWHSSLLLFVVLDLYLVASLAYMAQSSPIGHWRRAYATLGGAMVLYTVVDVAELAGRLQEGLGADIFYCMPHAVVALAAVDAARSAPHAGRIALLPVPRGRMGALLAYALVLPILHLGLGLAGLGLAAAERPRQVLVLLTLLVLLGLEWLYQDVMFRERSQLAEQGRKADADLRTLGAAIDQTDEGLMITDAEGVVEFVNPAFESIHSVTASAARGRCYWDLEGCSPVGTTWEDVRDRVARAHAWEGRAVCASATGTKDLAISVSPVREPDGSVSRLVGVVMDVTHEAALQSRLRQSQKMEALGTLAGGIAHDFNNILMAIYGYAERLRRRLGHDPQAQGDVESLLTAARRARDLVRQILTFSRQADSRPELVRVGAVALEVAAFLRATLPSTIRIETFADAESGLIRGNDTQIHQLLLNLGTNAAHAMPGGGVLRISVDETEIGADGRGDDRWVRVVVRDNGVGMSPETVDRIYDPFFTTRDVGEGTGLGLSVVHGIVVGHGGTIEVHTEPGEGSTFEVLLPARASGKPSGETPPQADQAPNRSTGRILVVDDEPAIAEIATVFLRDAGFDVDAASNGADALARLQERHLDYDLVITDQTMPGMTGLELARRLRVLNADVPLLLTTGYTAAAALEQTQELGVKEVLMKPFSEQTLLESVRRCVRVSAP